MHSWENKQSLGRSPARLLIWNRARNAGNLLCVSVTQPVVISALWHIKPFALSSLLQGLGVCPAATTRTREESLPEGM